MMEEEDIRVYQSTKSSRGRKSQPFMPIFHRSIEQIPWQDSYNNEMFEHQNEHENDFLFVDNSIHNNNNNNNNNSSERDCLESNNALMQQRNSMNSQGDFQQTELLKHVSFGSQSGSGQELTSQGKPCLNSLALLQQQYNIGTSDLEEGQNESDLLEVQMEEEIQNMISTGEYMMGNSMRVSQNSSSLLLSDCQTTAAAIEECKRRRKKQAEEKFVVKSMVAVDLEKQTNPGFEFRYYGEKPVLIQDPLQGFHFLSGDICIMNLVMQKRESSRFSELNSFKSPIRTYMNHRTGALEVDVNNKRNGLKNFGFLIEKMRQYQDVRMAEFANILEQYQGLVNDLQSKRSLVQDEPAMKMYSEMLDASYTKFEAFATEKLEGIAQTATFYSYTIHRLNLFNFEMEMKKFGFSEALLALLGLDTTLAQRYIWRRGLFDYADKRSIENLLYQLVCFKLGYSTSFTYDVKLQTFDNLDVYAKGSNQIFMSKDPQNPFLPYNEILLVQEFEISPSMITQVMEIRKLTKDKSMKYMRDIEEDLQYSMEATIFLEKYYKNKTDGFQPSNKRAGYREINKKS